MSGASGEAETERGREGSEEVGVGEVFCFFFFFLMYFRHPREGGGGVMKEGGMRVPKPAGTTN